MAHKSHLRRTGKETRCGFFVPLAVITSGAFLLRLVVCCELASANDMFNAVFAPSKATDLATYMRLGSEIASGVFPETFYYQPYYYSVFLPLILLIGLGVKGVIFFQMVCGTAAVFFSGLAAGMFAGKRGAVFSALLASLSVPLVFYTPYHQNETLQSLHLILLFYLGAQALLRGKLRHFLLTGLLCGISIATRGNIALIAIFFGISALIFPRRSNWKKRLGNTAAMAAVTCLVLLPFSLHNTLALGKLTGPSTAGDAVLALGNTPEAPAGGRNPGLPAGPMEYPEAFHRVMSDTQHGVGLGRSMFNWMCREPLAFFELQWRKLLLFWDAREIPNNVSLAGEGRTSPTLMLLKNCGLEYPLIICGVAGLLLLGISFRLRDPRLWWLAGFIVIYWGSIALFYNLSRFRAPILPVLAVSGSLLLRRRIKGRAIHRVAALLFAVFISVFACDSYRQLEPQIMRFIRPLGTIVPPAIGQTDYDILDHGPITFGDWRELELHSGDTLQKNFSVSGKATVLWKIFSTSPGVISVKSNSGDIITLELVKGENTLQFETPDAAECGFTVLHAPGGVFAVCDFRRDYFRSSYNGKKLSAEWVTRCRLPLDKFPEN
ncbi:MAG: glycosyltransferase family 39 protein [Lentisphaeria bacterium]|nr:glycosyltransferase family 39 protein [Lentisphaeria bacterium]